MTDETILLGRGHEMLEFPQAAWKQELARVPQHSQSRLDFMTDAHHQVRYLVVRELVTRQKPVEAEFIADALNLPLERVKSFLEELEQKLFFLVRDEHGSVAWAYPVTVDATPHSLNFASGERLYAAWAEDAIAAPFVQGQLRKEVVSVEAQTACKHCGRVMHLTIDSAMQVSVRERDASPLMFMPDVDWSQFAERTIIDSYWRNSVFFWSEEHAREYRAGASQPDGVYLTLEQCAYMTPITQGALFAFR